VANQRTFRLLKRSEDGGGWETEQLDRFLTRVADAGLIDSLRQAEQRRKRLWLGGLALALGMVIGGGAMILFLQPWEESPPAEAAAGSAEAARLLVSQGERLVWAKEFEKAWADLRLATELAPELIDAWDALTIAYFLGGRTVDAERALQRSLEIEPGYRRAYHMLGDVSFYLGDWAKAKEHYSKAGRRQRIFARIALLENRYADAVPLIRQLLRETPDDPYVKVMARALRAGRLTPEVRLLLEPTFVASRNPVTAEGWRLYHTRRYEEASVAFGRALQRQPRDGSALAGRGWTLLQLGTARGAQTAREAQSAFEQVLAIWPSNSSAINGMAWSLKAQGQSEGAAKLWRRVLDLPLHPNIEIAESLKGLGMVHYERGDFARANLYLGRSVMIDPHDGATAALLEYSLRRASASPQTPQTRP
jgi:tetratricopeptide (TPR) repeat protein